MGLYLLYIFFNMAEKWAEWTLQVKLCEMEGAFDCMRFPGVVLYCVITNDKSLIAK